MSDSSSACLTVAIQAAHHAGKLLSAKAGRPRQVLTKRSAIDLVTEVDRASEALIHRAIARRFPDHGFVGEERTRTNPGSPYQWIVDPIDGTTNFVHGVPVFAVSIGLLLRGRPVVGVIYDPMRKETFHAVVGKGAWLNRRRIRVSSTSRLADSLLSTGFSARFREDPEPYLRWFTAFQLRCHAVRRIGCTSLSLAYVSCGREDGFFERDLWPWDIAAGVLLVTEAGGRLSDLDGSPLHIDDGRAVASNGRIHGAMIRLLRQNSRHSRSSC
ncbi:MAG: inositol monophosphatase [Candidatus Omnitrophica bacterium]|nr:inositol monophosphatase [Candidatus Omnitrophota bacterium]